jgi:hypothetical protein
MDSIVPRNSVSEDGLGVGDGEGVAEGDGVGEGEGEGDGEGAVRSALPVLVCAGCDAEGSLVGPVTEPLEPHATVRPTAPIVRTVMSVRFQVFIVPSSISTVSRSARRPPWPPARRSRPRRTARARPGRMAGWDAPIVSPRDVQHLEQRRVDTNETLTPHARGR